MTGWRPSSSVPRRPWPPSSQVLQEATAADELIVTTITHSHTDRIRSFTLLAQEWFSEVHPQDRATLSPGL